MAGWFNFVMVILTLSMPYISTRCYLFTRSKTVYCNQHQANLVPSFPEYNGTLRHLEFTGMWIIRDLDYNSFIHAPLSEQLILQNIGLKRLSCDVFHKFKPELQILNLDDNLLDYFPACSLNNLWRLRTLTLSRNFIKCIPEHSIPSGLTHLDVSNNRIFSLNSDLSTDVHNKNQLKTLIIRSNNLRRISENELNQFSSLKYLDASENRLDYINSLSFLSPGIQLGDINLSHNQLTGTVWLCLEHTLEVRNLNLSHNLIELANHNVLSNMKSLQKLDISYNFLTSVGPAFVEQKNILLLLFRHNAIASVSSELFSTRSGFMEFFTLDLSFNSLASVDLVIPDCSACELSVHHNNLRTMSIISNRNSTFSLIDISFNSLESLPRDMPIWTNFNGSYNPFSTASVMEFLADFLDGPVHSVNLQNTSFLCQQSDNISDIHISSELSLHLEGNCVPSDFICRLKAVSSHQIHIFLDRNGIESVPECALNVSIVTLSLKGNHLTYLNESHVTQEMPDLMYLDIAENNLVSVDVSRLVTNTVLHFDVSMNYVKSLPTIIFYHYHFHDKEFRFDLSSNNIFELPALEFEDVSMNQSLSVIDISNNSLKYIPPIRFNHPFYMYSSILVLNASDNFIQSVFDVLSMAYSGSSGYTHINRFILDFSRNNITNLTNMITNCRSMFYSTPPSVINMTSNRLTDFPTCDVMDCYYRNVLLDFSHNFLRSLPNKESCVIIQASALNVSHNLFTEISSTIAYSALQYLNMNNNKISTIIPDAFNRLPDIKELDLSYNKLNVFPEAARQLAFLEKLNLAGNNILTVPDAGLASWPSLSLIHLQGNPLICSCSTAWLRNYTLQSDLAPCRYPTELQGNSVTCLSIASCDENKAAYSSKNTIRACFDKGIVFKNVDQTLDWNISSRHVKVTSHSRVDVSIVRNCRVITLLSSSASNASTFPDDVGENGEEICLTLSDPTWISNFTQCLILNRTVTDTSVSLTPANMQCQFTQTSDYTGYVYIGVIIALSILLVVETVTGIVLYKVYGRRRTVTQCDATVTSTAEQAVYENHDIGETTFSYGSSESSDRESFHYYESCHPSNK